jgi:hypothetical protein
MRNVMQYYCPGSLALAMSSEVRKGAPTYVQSRFFLVLSAKFDIRERLLMLEGRDFLHAQT